MLALRRGVVREAAAGPEQQLLVELEPDGARRPAIADTALVGPCEVGDEVIVNVAARELGLGSGGFDVVHVNLTRGLEAAADREAHVMKFNYTSLQHGVKPLEDEQLELPVRGAVAVIALHGQLAPLAWALGAARPGTRLGYVQTAGGALPASHSAVVRDLRERELLAAHFTAAPAYGGADGEAITTLGALHHGLTAGGWDAAVCGPGPGVVGSASALGHGGMAAFDSAHAALAIGAATLIVARMSSADPRERHRPISHHTRTVLELLLKPVTVALPEGHQSPDWGTQHDWRNAPADLDGYTASGLPTQTMGRTDPLFFAAALSAGGVLAELL
jgi:hypothetical protein